MKFNIGPYELTIAVEAAPLVNDSGCLVLTLMDLDHGLIRVSSDCPPRARPAAIAACVHDAWLMSVGRPQSVEESGRLFAMMAEAWTRDLEAQGGLEALRALAAKPGGRRADHGPDPFYDLANEIEAIAYRGLLDQ